MFWPINVYTSNTDTISKLRNLFSGINDEGYLYIRWRLQISFDYNFDTSRGSSTINRKSLPMLLETKGTMNIVNSDVQIFLTLFPLAIIQL